MAATPISKILASPEWAVALFSWWPETLEFLPFQPHLCYLLTVRDQTPRLWHVPTGTDLGTFPHDPGRIPGGSDGETVVGLATLVDDRALHWNLDVDTWPEIACRAAGRNLTTEEWEQFGPEESDYPTTCSQWAGAS